MQRALWTSQRRHPTAPLQNMAKLSHLDGPVDHERLIAAFADVVGASDVLSARIVDDGGTPMMVPVDESPVTEVIDLDRSRVHAWADERVSVPIDATVRPYDSVIVRHEDGTTSWYLALHHLVTDAASSALVFAATAARYQDEIPEIASYQDWVSSLGVEAGPRVERAVRHWNQRDAAQTVARLYEPVRSPTTDSSRVPVAIDHDRVVAGLAGDFRQMTDELAWTALLMTATAVVMHKVARVDEFALGLPVHNRSGAQKVVGTVMEVFPVDIVVNDDDTLRALHKRISKSIMTTMRHAVPGLAPSPDYEAVINVIPGVELGPFGDVPVRHEVVDSCAVDPTHLLRVQLNAYGDDGLGLVLDINHGGADEAARRRAGLHMAATVHALVDDPDATVGSIELRDPMERHAQQRWEHAADFAETSPDIVSWMATTVATRTDVVIEDAAGSLTGVEFWRRARLVAEHLQSLGVGPGERVGIEMPRRADTVIAIVATLLAGGSYVPLDPAQPRARLDALIERAACRTVLTELPLVGDSEPTIATPAAVPEAEAYLLYTSGSTGEPKGVPITHRGLARYIQFAAQSYTDPANPPVVGLFSALTFDLTVTSVFTPLVVGGKTVVIEADGGAGLAAIAARPDITWLKATPSHLEVLVRLVDREHSLRTLVVGGEAFGSTLAKRLNRTLPGVRIFNEYGPTEAVVGCMIHESSPDELDRWAEVPIGRPAPGVTLVVVDDALRRVPTGAQGELCISHVGLTAGYLGAMTEQEDGSLLQSDGPFVQIDGRRFYRSGDLVRMADDQTLVYLGRIDEQVKVGGIRLEPIEVADALERHPAVGRAAVRLWSPETAEADRHCTRCGLPSNVPGTVFDDAGVCQMCHAYDRVAPITESWFKTRDDLAAWAEEAHRRRTGDYDCLHLLSGGKDSTYALYQLVEAGFRPYALTLDNGFISEGAKDNVRRSVADLGIDHEFATHESMDAIFRDSLDRHSNVCHGCYKTIYTLATTRAVELGIPLVVTGLSRGQLFETRLIPQQFSDDRFDPDAIDRAVIEARKAYHRIDDGTNRLLDTSVFASDDVFDDVTYLDFYRYVDVELAEMLEFLDTKAPWVRPSDTGRSTNCLVNAAGIHTHLTEQGYHNYAEPYAWDVRLGHKTRDEAMAELDDQLDMNEVDDMLSTIGYEPRRRETLVAWIEPADPSLAVPGAAELRSFLGDLLPTHAIPSAFVAVEQLPLTTNGKLDTAALPPPERVHRGGAAIHVSAESETERRVVGAWEQVLAVEPIGVDDDFFAIGGDSLAAMQMIVAVSDRCGWAVPEEFAFLHTTPRELAAALDAFEHPGREPGAAPGLAGPEPRPAGEPPAVSVGEQAILFDQQIHPGDARYNVGQVHLVHGSVDVDRFTTAIRTVVARHTALHWTHGPSRRALAAHESLMVDARTAAVDPADVDIALRDAHRAPFDLEHGPLVRAVVQPVTDGTTAVLLAFHHVSGDADSFDRIWRQLDTLYSGGDLPPVVVDYAAFTQWQAASVSAASRDFWLRDTQPSAALVLHAPATPGPDGFIKRAAAFSPAELHAVAGASGFAVALASLAAVVARRSDGDRVGIGVIASNRNHPAAEDLVGYFLNTLPIQVEVDGGSTVADLSASAGRTAGAALVHRDVALADIVAARRRAGLPAPSVDILLAHDRLETASLGSNRVDHHVMFNGTAVAGAATVFVEERDDRVDLSMEFAGDVMTEADAELLLADLEAMMRAVIAEPLRRVDGVALPSDGTAVLRGPHLAEVPGTVTDDVLDAAGRRAAEPAVICGDRTLSWAELDQRSSALGAAMQRQGVRAGDRALLCLPRSVDLVAAIVATHRIGASYVPLDPSYPADRIEAAAAAAGAVVSLVDAGTNVDLPAELATLDVTEIDSGTAIDTPPGPADEAYLIFTSGSTGRPRGVPVTHRTLSASTRARVPAYDTQPERFLVVSSLAFDSSVAGLFWTLVSGGTVVLPTDAEVHDPDALLGLFEHAGVTHTLMVPTLYAALLERGAGATAWPQQVIVAGEACPARLARRHHELRPGHRLANEYGPTECTVWATVHHVEAGDDPVPIGPPIAGTTVAVLDDLGRAVPAGVQGLLAIGGAGVVSGYLDDHAATAERFGRDSDGGPVFFTGDRAVVRDGTVHFLGRRDHQLNVGGVRAEPEEIEAVLTTEDGVGAAIVVATDPRSLTALIESTSPSELSVAMARAASAADPAAALADALREFSPDADPVLVAHLEAVSGSMIDEAPLRRRAQRDLPAGLRPRRYVIHERLPRSPTGKLDRDAAAALPVPDAGQTSHPNSIQDTDQVAAVARLFTDTLGTPVGPEESFFDMGGHSLLALALVERIADVLGTELGVAELYEHPTPAGVAELLEDRGHVVSAGEYVVPIQTSGTRPPLFGVHVLGVNAEYYRPLAVRLGLDQPVYGLGLATTLEDADAPTAIDHIATLYANELERVAPQGPVALAAVSLGAVVAFELASTMRARGRDVVLVSLFDAAGFDIPNRPNPGDRLRSHLDQLSEAPARYLNERRINLTLRATRRAEQVELKARTALRAELPDRLRVRTFIEANAQAALTHQIAPYDGSVAVFLAEVNPFGRASQDPKVGWGSVAIGDFAVVPVPGGHLSMLAEPHVADLAEALTTQLDRAADKTTTATGLDVVEAQLRHALHTGAFAATVEALGRRDDLTAEAATLVSDAEATLLATAATAIDAAGRLESALAGAGVAATVDPVSRLAERSWLTVRTSGDPIAVVDVLAGLGYRPQTPMSPGAWRAVVRTSDRLTMIALDDASTRVTVVWDGRQTVRKSDPTEADFAAWNAPAFAWPLYWAVRPGRLAVDRLKGRRGGGDLGRYLGTSPALVSAVLDLAEPGSDELLVDIGCGDGRVLVEAVRRYGCRARGIERDHDLVAAARRRVTAAGLEDRIEIVHDDASAVDVGDADVVFAFLPAEAVAGLLPRVLAALPEGGRFVTHEQVRGDWPIEPDRSTLVVRGGVTVASVWTTASLWTT